LPNRAWLVERLHDEIEQARENGGTIGVLFLDLDRFKAINDTYGHIAGDTVLRSVALRLKAGVRATDTVARAGGDEFMVLLEELSDEFEAEEVRRKLHQLLAEPIDLGVAQATIGASIGVAIYPDHADDFVPLMDHADRDMYGLKRANAQPG
jgi:diguanylate cyclase (GGDEF)-like protein